MADRKFLPDVNADIYGLLRDLAAIQTAKSKEFGYKRAAAAVWSLDEPLDRLREQHGEVPRIRGLGPATLRVVNEVLDQGHSPTVDAAVANSGREVDILRRRGLRQFVLSRAAVRMALADSTLGGPDPSSYRGDLQMHSEWSDGSLTVAAMAHACAGRGYAFCAITDHAGSLKIAGGLTREEVARQQREIEAFNMRGADCRVLKGIEANIDAAGNIDIEPADLALFDLVLAAPHSRLRLQEDQTPRMLRAVTTPGVHILAHPRGRMAGSRAGVVADWDAVFAAAADHRVAIEIDGDPARQDLDYVLAKRAVDAGCLFALDSDAHDDDQLIYAETAIAHARLAGVPPARIVNCWPLKKLLAWADERRRA
jgi:putative hydrolase